MRKTILLVTAVVFATITAGAQTLDEQYQNMKQSAYSYKEYKNIKETDLNAFWGVVQDSLKTKAQAYANAQGTITAQEDKIKSLNETITTQKSTIEEKEFDTTHISVLGLEVGKDAYKTFNIIAIVALLLGLGVLFYQFRSSQKIAVSKKRDYDKLSEDFEEYKRNALEKQMKLRRELQTERNRIDDIRSA